MVQTTAIKSETASAPANRKIQQGVITALSTVRGMIEAGKGLSEAWSDANQLKLSQVYDTLIEVENGLQHNGEDVFSSMGVNPLQTLLDILPVGIFILQNSAIQTMTINRAGLRILDLPADKTILPFPVAGESLPFTFLREGRELSIEELPILQVIKENQALGNVELDVKHADGRMLNLIVYASPLHDEKGEVTGSLAVMVEITARKSVEKRLMMQYTIAHILAESNTINRAAPQVMQMICQTAHWEYGALWQVEPDINSLTNKGVWYSGEGDLSDYAEKARYSNVMMGENTLPSLAYKKEESLWLSKLDDSSSAYIQEARRVGFRSAYLLPVKSRHHVVAVLELLSFHPQGHEKHISDMFNAVGNQVGIFLERKILEEMLAVRANQQHLLAEAGIALSSSFDLEKRLNNITHLVVPEIADWCAIDTIDQGNVLRRIAAAHVDESKEQLLYTIQPTRTINFDQDTRPQIQTLFTGQSLLYPEVSLSLIEASISNPEQLEAIRQLNPISSIIVPLIAHNKTQGILTFVYSDSSRRYSSGDLALAEDIARRTALAVENALLYNESQKLNAELEQRVDKRTAQLRTAIDELRKQIMERQNAEERIHNLNAELEQRIEQRTSQLEIANRELNKELVDRKKTSEALKILLKRTRELYRISQTIGVVKTPSEVLGLLLSSSYLKSVSRASIAILERPWLENGPPPENCFILTEWNRGVKQPRFFGRRFTLEEYGLRLPVPYGQPIVIQDIQSVMELPERVRKRFADLATHSLIILPLVAGGEWFGLLSLHFKTRRMTNMDDLRHVRGLVDEAAIVIKNMRLLEAESQARHDAERANELKLKFLGMISHELRTPLTSIKGFTTTLLAEDVQWPPEKQRDFLMTISQESDKLHELIEQLLDLSRIEAGVLRIAPVEVSLAKVIESARPQLSALTIEHELKIEIPPDLPLLVADEQRIAQVVTNLVSNAVKFSPAHSQIILMARTDGKNIQVDVADQGAGIPAADRQRVFAAFRQLENGSSSQAKGAGLGLAICKGLVEAHHGRIWVQDHEQPGTVISFTLPAMAKMNPVSIR